MPADSNASDPSLTARTWSGLKWSYLAAAVETLLSVLILAVLSRLLRPADFGLFGMALILTGPAEAIGGLSVGLAVVQRHDLTNRHVEAAVTLSLVLGAATMAVMWLLAPLSGPLFDEQRAPEVVRALSVVFVIASLGVVSEHLLRRRLLFRNLTVATVLSQAIGGGLTTIAMAFLGFGVWSLVWGTIVRRAIHTLMVVQYSPWPFRPRLAPREAFDLLRHGVGFSFVSLFNTAAEHGASFVVGRRLGAAALGYYTRALSLVFPPLRLGYILLHALFPAMSERQRRTDRLSVVYLLGVEMLSLIGLPVGVLVFVSAPEIVAVVLGAQWDAVVPVLRILATIVVFSICEAINPPLVRALGAVYREARIQVVFAAVAVSGAWFGSRWGLSGIAVAAVGARIVVYLLTTQLALSLLDLPWRRLLRCHLPALWVGVLTTPALWLAALHARSTFGPAGLSLAIELLAWSVAAVVAIYSAPSFLRLSFVPWALKHMDFEAMGTTGRCLRYGLERFPTSPRRG